MVLHEWRFYTWIMHVMWLDPTAVGPLAPFQKNAQGIKELYKEVIAWLNEDSQQLPHVFNEESKLEDQWRFLNTFKTLREDGGPNGD